MSTSPDRGNERWTGSPCRRDTACPGHLAQLPSALGLGEPVEQVSSTMGRTPVSVWIGELEADREQGVA